jgi:hypothetical protein
MEELVESMGMIRSKFAEQTLSLPPNLKVSLLDQVVRQFRGSVSHRRAVRRTTVPFFFEKK